MKLTILGTRSPFPGMDQSCPGYLVEAGEQRILLDCGTGVVARLERFVPVKKLSAVIITHLHPDHSVDLIPLGFGRLRAIISGEATRLPLYLPPGGGAVFRSVVGAMGNLERHFDQAFEFLEYESASTLELGDLNVEFNATEHPMNCHAVTLRGRSIICYSGDSAECDELAVAARFADIFLCEAGAQDPETARNAKHLLPEEAGEIAAKAGAKLLVLTHFLPGADLELKRRKAGETFEGAVEVAVEGQTYVLPD